ncbi:phage tail sheath subtilisin-like domain-containing protein [Microcoleus sp. FACHB-1515]|uniref:phage tail sheath subtilisin-like domain-containing protein n=1 Tax=Cyanophyceae TaxID=3028117 RepID=UPI001688410F|nr:phage tail sheath subtilisin-like domain-containing protein [Microcoleus sp. FACHB-1515]MBD2089951.1 phage tail sheath subtilisin-like domain-containing protein [Microcoleus sp. FACHB-1515]
MAVQVSYPGVYIDEFAPGAPIQGVGTSTAAFIGPAASGELDTPTKITSWDQFRQVFGALPLPGFFLWYAVRGFFENGGQVCYVVRASNGKNASLLLEDDADHDIVKVRSRQPGNPSTPIQVALSRSHLLPAASASLYRPTANYTAAAGREITLDTAANAAQFRPGDFITLNDVGERVQIARISGNKIRLADNLTQTYPANGTVRIANAPVGTQTIRITSTAPIASGALVAGTVLTITQGTLSSTRVVETVQAEINGSTTTYRVTFRQGLSIPLSFAQDATVQSQEFNLEVTQGASVTYPNLSIDSAHPRYFLKVVNEAGGLVQLERIEPFPRVDFPAGLLKNLTATSLAGGENENLATIDDQDYIDALETLREIDDVNLIAIPDRTTAPVQQAVITHCEQMGDRFAVLDASTADLKLFGAGSVEAQRRGLDSTRGYSALYYPWLRVPPTGRGDPVLVPPSGHVCGIIARSDTLRGVHKAPANEIVNGAIGVGRSMSNIDQGQLNLQGINVIRIFQNGGRPVLFGARTTATDLNWQYVNIRRLFLFVEESIQEGIRWAVFEPNNLQLWEKVKRTITEFLTRVWRDGALFGATAKEAFYVRIDETLNPFSEQALGRLNIEIGLRPTYPAEFIIVRIGIWQGDAQVTEG